MNVKQKHTAIGCLGVFLITTIAVIVIIATLSSGASKTIVNTGINPDSFDKMVNEKMNEIDTSDVIDRIETSVYSNTAIVKLYLKNLASWSASPDVEKKEFVNTMGKLMDTIASITALPGTETIAVSTRIYSPSGLELAERTIWGDVKLK